MDKVIAGIIDRLVRGIVVPVTNMIPALVERGILLALFAALWIGFGAALVADQQVVARAWAALGALPLPVQGVAWLLFLPLMAGLWVWGTDWPLVVRLVVVAGIAGWNLLVFVPRRVAEPAAAAS